MSHVFLLRHGATAATGCYCGSTDVPLNDDGWRQMWAAVEGREWQRVVSSPLRRCADFAAALTQRLGLTAVEDARWREMHFGDWEGRSAAQLMDSEPHALRRFWEDPFQHTPPHAEPLTSVRERVLAQWQALLAGPVDERVLVITHGGPIRLLIAELLRTPLNALLNIEVAHGALIDTGVLMKVSAS